MASEKAVINALKDNPFLTTGQVYGIVKCKWGYPLIRLVRQGKISCILYKDTCYYFLEENVDKLPSWLKEGKRLKGNTAPLIIEAEYRVDKDLETFYNSLDNSYFDPSLLIEKTASDEENEKRFEEYKLLVMRKVLEEFGYPNIRL